MHGDKVTKKESADKMVAIAIVLTGSCPKIYQA